MVDPFLIRGPAVLSFSGGRTSGYMLWRVLQAHGGKLPDDVLVTFGNTGREMPVTLDFIAEVEQYWGVRIWWLEYRYLQRGDDGRHKHGFQVVDFGTASRNGEPMDQVIRARGGFLPNVRMRFCTAELKIRTMERFVKARTGWKSWTQVVGLRADEPGRVMKATDPARQKKQGSAGWVVCPLYDAGVTEDDVLAFWKTQPFDLRLKGKHEGNCDGCFLKSRRSIAQMWRDHPERMRWWEEHEAAAAARGAAHKPEMSQFNADRSYAELRRYVEVNDSLKALARGEVFDDRTGCEIACTD